jgi:pilus assembly protein CpaB
MDGKRGIVMLVIALVAGIAAVVLAARWIQQRGQTTADRVAVAQADIELGSRLTPEMVQLVAWPASSVPNGVFNDPKALDGRVALQSMQRGEPILESKLAPLGTKGGLSSVVAAGKRAITVRVNDVVGVAGFTLPGNYVDIMVNTQQEGARSGDADHAISKIVLERILVLAVAQESDRDTTKPKVVNAVTLEVTPEQAEQLDLARSVGNLSLVLRNETDPAGAHTAGATKDQLLGALAAPPKAAPKAAARQAPRPVVAVAMPPPVPETVRTQSRDQCVELIRGGTKSVECF